MGRITKLILEADVSPQQIIRALNTEGVPSPVVFKVIDGYMYGVIDKKYSSALSKKFNKAVLKALSPNEGDTEIGVFDPKGSIGRLLDVEDKYHKDATEFEIELDRKANEGFQKVMGKFQGMRKAVDWTVYPHSEGDEEIIIQSKRYMAKVNVKTGKAILSQAGKSMFMGLSKALGAKDVDAPKDIVDQLKKLSPTGKQVRIM